MSKVIILSIGILVLIVVVAYFMIFYKPTPIQPTGPIVTITPQLPPEFQTTIQNFLKERLKTEYYPNALTFSEPKRADTPKDINYAAKWIVQDTNLTLAYSSNGKIEFMILNARIPELTSLNENVANSLADQFFHNFKKSWKCEQTVNFTSCESFWVEKNNDKKGVFVLKLSNSNIIASCLIPAGSKFYYSNSCIGR